jgi:membrane-associated phospholipid phosphatase
VYIALAEAAGSGCSLAGVAVATAVMMYCRTYLAAHWLSDTFEGLLVGGGLGLVLWWLFEPELTRDRGKPVRLPGRAREDSGADEPAHARTT